MPEPSRAVFLSYASQDALLARRLCDALRGAGIEVWFDQSELRGGDAWDQKIRRQIRDCALFIPIISSTTQVRTEGYFRLEWRLADQRTHLMGRSRAFLVPVCLGEVSDIEADVPDSFTAAQWTRLPEGEIPPDFVLRVSNLLSPGVQPGTGSARQFEGGSNIPAPPRPAVPVPKPAEKLWSVWVPVGVLIFGAGYMALDRFAELKHSAAPVPAVSSAVAAVAAAAPRIPEKSIAVMPFEDLSEKHDQAYFSDGLSEELIDLLSRIPELRVPARTSSFYFKGKQTPVAEIAKALGVAHLLEGSVRESGDKIRVTTQLIRADTGYNLWSETYERSVGDIFKIQDDITGAVVKALSVRLLQGTLPQNARTTNTEAYALYLQGRAYLSGNSVGSTAWQDSVQHLEAASKLDPKFAPTWAALSRMYTGTNTGAWSGREAARRDANLAMSLDPDLPEAHVAMARVLTDEWKFTQAQGEFDRALALDGANAMVLRNAAYLSRWLGRWNEAVQRLRAAMAVDPLNVYTLEMLGAAEIRVGNLADAETVTREALRLHQDPDFLHTQLAIVLWLQGKPTDALAEAQLESDAAVRATHLPIFLYAVGRTADADRALAEAETGYGETGPYDIGVAYAARKDFSKAFPWWNRALERHDLDLLDIKSVPIIAQAPELATDPRFKALLRQLNLPE